MNQHQQPASFDPVAALRRQQLRYLSANGTPPALPPEAIPVPARATREEAAAHIAAWNEASQGYEHARANWHLRESRERLRAFEGRCREEATWLFRYGWPITPQIFAWSEERKGYVFKNEDQQPISEA